MFDMPLWATYLSEYCANAEKAGATPVDVAELLTYQAALWLVRAKAEEARHD